jgi:hypothetical protein
MRNSTQTHLLEEAAGFNKRASYHSPAFFPLEKTSKNRLEAATALKPQLAAGAGSKQEAQLKLSDNPGYEIVYVPSPTPKEPNRVIAKVRPKTPTLRR